MPFANYDDFEACVRAHDDKDDPEAYCATIERQVEGQSEEFDALEARELIEAAEEHGEELLAEFFQAAIVSTGLPEECRKCGSPDRMEGSMVCASCAEEPAQQAEADDTHIFGPHTNGTSIRLEADEVYCENEGKAFDQFEEAESDDADRRCCPYCSEQLQDYDKLHNCSTAGPDQQAVITGLSQEAIDAISDRYNADVRVVDGEGGAAPTDTQSPTADE